MGMIRNIVFIVLSFWIYNLSAQEVKDTLVENGQMYLIHSVQPSESYNSISKKYSIDINILKQINKYIELYYRQRLRIPIKSTFSDRVLFTDRKSKKIDIRKRQDTINIALLLPFYTTKNDSLLSYLAKSDQSEEDIYKESYMALSFLNGVIIAIDSLKRSGANINLFVYDTENDTSKVKQLINAGKLKKVDLIIGPAYQKNLSIVTKLYGKNNNKTIISPLSKNSNVLKHGTNIFQIIPPKKLQIKKISDFVLKKYKKERVLILAQKKDEKYVKEYKSIFKKDQRRVKACLFSDLNTITRDTICKFLSKHNYLILTPSSDRSFVSKLISVLGTIDTSMIVFGLHNWKSFENLDVETLMKLNVHFPDPFYFDYNDVVNKRFLLLYKQKFNAIPDKYAQVAFNQIMYFCINKGVYDFKRYYARGGQVNHKFPIVKYQDYSITKLK